MMGKIHLTAIEIKYIMDHRLKVSGRGMAHRLGVNKNIVFEFLKQNNLCVAKEVICKFQSKATKEMHTRRRNDDDRKIRTLYPLAITKIAKRIKRSKKYVRLRLLHMGLDVTPEMLKNNNSK